MERQQPQRRKIRTRSRRKTRLQQILLVLMFGVATNSNALGQENNLRFPGMYYDKETGLYYNDQRYYDPEVGQYTQPEPLNVLEILRDTSIRNIGSMVNKYAYGENRPLITVDVEGNTPIQVFGFLVGALTGGLNAYASGGDAQDILFRVPDRGSVNPSPLGDGW